MTKTPVNDTGNRQREGYVRPYWLVQDGAGSVLLIAHRCAVADAEIYGDFLTSPHDHYDLWEGWRAGCPPDGLAAIVLEAEYEEWPRRRVMFNFARGQFVVSCDSRVFEHELQHRVLEYFGIPADYLEFSKDGHYQSTQSLHWS
jgi:hypothetical protein